MGQASTTHNLKLALQGAELLITSLNAELDATAKSNPVLAMVLRDQLQLAGQVHQRLCELNAVGALFGPTNNTPSYEEVHHG